MRGDRNTDPRAPESVTVNGGPPPGGEGSSGRVWLLLAGAVVVSIGGLALLGLFGAQDPAPDAQPLPATSTTAATTTTTEPTTTTLSPEALAAMEYEADAELIKQLWWDHNLAWFDGFDSGLRFWVDHNYPPMGCTFDDYMASWFPTGPIEGLQIERIVNTPTIEPDAGWVIPGGKLKGVSAEGRVYVMAVRDTFAYPGDVPAPVTRALHVTILDGEPYFFIGCPG